MWWIALTGLIISVTHQVKETLNLLWSSSISRSFVCVYVRICGVYRVSSFRYFFSSKGRAEKWCCAYFVFLLLDILHYIGRWRFSLPPPSPVRSGALPPVSSFPLFLVVPCLIEKLLPFVNDVVRKRPYMGKEEVCEKVVHTASCRLRYIFTRQYNI
jgi:hypothetical protein